MDIILQTLPFLALLILLGKTLGALSRRVGLPAVLGELLAGVILGPTVLNIWRFGWFAPHATTTGALPISLAGIIRVFAQVGVVVLMFLAGLETDLGMMKAVAGSAFWAALGGVLMPFAGGATLARGVGFGWPEALFIGTVLTATSVSITAQTLMNLEKLRSRAGSTILGAAVIDDVLGLVVLSVVVAAEAHPAGALGSGWARGGLNVARVVGFSGSAFWLGPRLVRFLFNPARRLAGTHTLVAVGLGIAFVFAFLAEAVGGMAAITGAYLAGLFVASTPARAQVMEGMRSMTDSFFGPLFFASVGLGINARQARGHLGFLLLILAVAVFGKVVGCGLGAWFGGLKGRECLAVGVGMIPRGEVGLITASIGWATGLISAGAYSVVVVLVFVTTLITPLLLRFAFAPSAPRRDILADPLAQVAPGLSSTHAAPKGGTTTSRARPVAGVTLLVALLVLMSTGCGVKKIAINKIGDALANGGTTFTRDDDPDLIRDAVPFSLKLMESLLAESPRHRGLLLTASKGFTEYAYAFVQEDADETEERDFTKATALRTRARRLYLRARDYGLRGLEVRHPGFGQALRDNPKRAVRRIISAKEVPLLYWTAASWGLAVSVSKDIPDLIADQPIVEALIDRAFALDEDYDGGAIHGFLISYEPSRPGGKGDPLERSRTQFGRAVELSGGELAGPYVSLAETVSVQTQDRAEFQSLLKRALAIDVNAKPEWRLENLVMQRRARWLLARVDELFVQ